MSRRRGFTLIELLVVIGVILVLVAILLPAVGRVWDSANATKCQSNLTTLSKAFFAFANDNDGHLPGSENFYWSDRNPNHYDWLFGQYSVWWAMPDPNYTLMKRLECAPQYGTIWKYVNSYPAYLCPSLTAEKPGSGIGSNGRFDYYAFECFAGAKITDIKPYSQLHYAMDPTNPTLLPDPNSACTGQPGQPGNNGGSTYSLKIVNYPTPLIAQEDSLYFSNWQLDTNYGFARRMTHIHNGGSYYASIDGSINFVNEPDTDPTIPYWQGESLWWQAGPQTGNPTIMNFDPGADYDTSTPPNAIGWGYWSHK